MEERGKTAKGEESKKVSAAAPAREPFVGSRADRADSETVDRERKDAAKREETEDSSHTETADETKTHEGSRKVEEGKVYRFDEEEEWVVEDLQDYCKDTRKQVSHELKELALEFRYAKDEKWKKDFLKTINKKENPVMYKLLKGGAITSYMARLDLMDELFDRSADPIRPVELLVTLKSARTLEEAAECLKHMDGNLYTFGKTDLREVLSVDKKGKPFVDDKKVESQRKRKESHLLDPRSSEVTKRAEAFIQQWERENRTSTRAKASIEEKDSER